MDTEIVLEIRSLIFVINAKNGRKCYGKIVNITGDIYRLQLDNSGFIDIPKQFVFSRELEM
jgi:hypothetical protein